MNSKNDELREAIDRLNLGRVKWLLKSDVDPNFNLPQSNYYDTDVSYDFQPFSPLRLIVFITTSCDRIDGDSKILFNMAHALIEAGADAVSAERYADWLIGDIESWRKEKKWETIQKSDPDLYQRYLLRELIYNKSKEKNVN